MEKHLEIRTLAEHDEVRQNLDYWLSRTPDERVAAVDYLRRQVYRGRKPKQEESKETAAPFP